MKKAFGVLFSQVILFSSMALPALADTSLKQTAPQMASVPMTATDWNRQVQLPQFDPNLGTLAGVRFHLVGALQDRVKSNVVVQGLDAVQIVLGDAQSPIAQLDLEAGGTVKSQSLPGFGAFQTQRMLVNGVEDLTKYIGTGSVSLPISATAQFLLLESGGQSNTSLTTRSSAQVSITYFYY